MKKTILAFISISLFCLMNGSFSQTLSGIPSECAGMKGEKLDSCARGDKGFEKKTVAPGNDKDEFKALETSPSALRTPAGIGVTNVIAPKNAGMPIPLGQSDLDPPTLTNLPVLPRK